MMDRRCISFGAVHYETDALIAEDGSTLIENSLGKGNRPK